MSANIQFPQGPMVGPDDYVTLEWQQWLQNPQFVSFSTGNTLTVSGGGTGLTSGTSGGVLAFTATSILQSSGLLGLNRLMLGGGAGGVPATIASLGTVNTVLHGNAGGAPTFSAVDLSADVSGVLPVPSGGTGTNSFTAHGVLLGNATSAIAVSAVGATNTILQGNTGADPSFKNTIDAIAIGGTNPAAGAFTSVASTGAITSSSPTAGVGYATGAGGSVVQGAGSGKATAVTLNTACGTITMNNGALNAATIVSFTVTDSACAATDCIHVQHDSVGTLGGYTVCGNTPASGSFQISVRNNTAGSLSEAIVLRFAIIKSVVT